MLRPLRTYRDVHARAEAALETVGLVERRDELVRNLSHGEQRQVEIALALLGDPKVLLLDEPTAGLSPAESAQMTRAVQRLDASMTILLIEHDMDVVFDVVSHITVLHRAGSSPRGPRRRCGATRACKRSTSGTVSVLRVEDVHTYYGDSHVLQGVSLELTEGGSWRCSAATAPARRRSSAPSWASPAPAGRVRLGQTDITRWRPYRIARLGVSLVPQGRQIFPSLDVTETLVIAGRPRPDGWTLDRVWELFPPLRGARPPAGEPAQRR